MALVILNRFCVVVGAVTGAAAVALAFVVQTTATAQPPVHYRKIGDTPGFPRLRQALQRIVNAHGRDKLNTFCIMLADNGDKDPLAFAIWRERHLLYRWHETNAPQVNDEALVLHVPLDLRKDVVRTRADKSSTYLVTRAWVRDIEQQCRDHGEVTQIIRGAK